MENFKFQSFTGFQYKICYSKIKMPLTKITPEYNFNTKFVIAKL